MPRKNRTERDRVRARGETYHDRRRWQNPKPYHRQELRALQESRSKCPSKKLRFEGQYEADRYLVHWVWGGLEDGRDRPSRAYECPLCQGWHLTKRELDAKQNCVCGAHPGEKHELTCPEIPPAELFARTGGRINREATP